MLFRFLALALLSVSVLWAETPEEKGLRIAKELDSANEGFVGEFADLEMVLINAHGDQVVRKMTNETTETEGDGDRSLSTFLWPADVKDTRMLTWSHKDGEDDQWLYLPALKRVKRISSRNKSGAFMGSEFSYEDLGSQEVEEYHYTWLADEDYEGRACWKLERVPVSDKSGYSREVGWFDKEYMNPLRIEYFDRKGELLKIAAFREYRKIERWWRVTIIEMENVQTKKRSVLTWKDREIGRQFDSSRFASDTMVD